MRLVEHAGNILVNLFIFVAIVSSYGFAKDVVTSLANTWIANGTEWR